MSKNIFGGGNPNSLYVPLSETEQEVLDRLVHSGDLRVRVVKWGWVMNPRVTFGDARIQIRFVLDFDRPALPVPVHFFDLELWKADDLLLYKERQSVTYAGKPVQIAAGVYMELVWDIAIQHIHPEVVKAIKPGALGLTSRLQDRDTKQITLHGNMDLNTEKRKALYNIREGEKKVRKGTKRNALLATKASGE